MGVPVVRAEWRSIQCHGTNNTCTCLHTLARPARRPAGHHSQPACPPSRLQPAPQHSTRRTCGLACSREASPVRKLLPLRATNCAHATAAPLSGWVAGRPPPPSALTAAPRRLLFAAPRRSPGWHRRQPGWRTACLHLSKALPQSCPSSLPITPLCPLRPLPHPLPHRLLRPLAPPAHLRCELDDVKVNRGQTLGDVRCVALLLRLLQRLRRRHCRLGRRRRAQRRGGGHRHRRRGGGGGGLVPRGLGARLAALALVLCRDLRDAVLVVGVVGVARLEEVELGVVGLRPGAREGGAPGGAGPLALLSRRGCCCCCHRRHHY